MAQTKTSKAKSGTKTKSGTKRTKSPTMKSSAMKSGTKKTIERQHDHAKEGACDCQARTQAAPKDALQQTCRAGNEVSCEITR